MTIAILALAFFGAAVLFWLGVQFVGFVVGRATRR
jgi:hypothetical protein